MKQNLIDNLNLKKLDKFLKTSPGNGVHPLNLKTYYKVVYWRIPGGPTNMLVSEFIKAELNAYIEEQRLTESPLMVKLICKAFEAYDQYKRLVSDSSNYSTHFLAGTPVGIPLNEVKTITIGETSFRMNPEPGPLD